MGTTPRLGTAAAAEPATSRMTLVWAGLHHPIREYASPPPTTLTTMNYETSKTSTEKVRMMFIIISTKCSLWYTNVEQELVLQHGTDSYIMIT